MEASPQLTYERFSKILFDLYLQFRADPELLVVHPADVGVIRDLALTTPGFRHWYTPTSTDLFQVTQLLNPATGRSIDVQYNGCVERGHSVLRMREPLQDWTAMVDL